MLRTERKLKILLVVDGFVSDGGEFYESVPAIAAALVRNGAYVLLATREGAATAVFDHFSETTHGGVHVVKFRPSFMESAKFSWKMLLGLGRLIRAADVVYLHGQGSFPLWWAGRCAKRAHRMLVFRPNCSDNSFTNGDSSNDEGPVSNRDDELFHNADAIHVSSDAEREWVLRIPGMIDLGDRIFIVRNGVSVPATCGAGAAEAKRTDGMPGGRSGTRTLLYLGRISPEKGLDNLLEALWIHVGVEASGASDAGSASEGGARLVICGPDEAGTRLELEKKAAELGIAKLVEFREPVHGDEKWKLIESSDCVVLPSPHEYYGLAVAEALACGKPAICTQGTPWDMLNDGAPGAEGAEKGRMGWWTPSGAAGLASAIGEFCACSDEDLEDMGCRGRIYAWRELSWDKAAASILRHMV
jgi:glycosyltransferase involved in cell wall biosynthesis